MVPEALRLRDRVHESYSREEGDWRQGHFVYLGTPDLESSIAYVKMRMPQHNWVTAEESVVETSTRIRFVRDIYESTFTFSRQEGLTLMVVDYDTDYSRR